jgi:hypothetical protein
MADEWENLRRQAKKIERILEAYSCHMPDAVDVILISTLPIRRKCQATRGFHNECTLICYMMKRSFYILPSSNQPILSPINFMLETHIFSTHLVLSLCIIYFFLWAESLDGRARGARPGRGDRDPSVVPG